MIGRFRGKTMREEAGQVRKRVRKVIKGLANHFLRGSTFYAFNFISNMKQSCSARSNSEFIFF